VEKSDVLERYVHAADHNISAGIKRDLRFRDLHCWDRGKSRPNQHGRLNLPGIENQIRFFLAAGREEYCKDQQYMHREMTNAFHTIWEFWVKYINARIRSLVCFDSTFSTNG
jgi:hypothetical protein